MAFVVLGLAAAPAHAHGTRPAGPASGISIPGLTHGQMAVIADYRRAILSLAARQPQTDETFRRLLNYAEIERAYCLWGLVPGSVSDEGSPFNECSHAYLAATKALLAYMRDMPGQKETVGTLISDIDADMVRNGASFVLCRYSEEPFNTASFILPRWRDIPFHPASLLTAMLFALGLAACARLLARRKRSA